jgi:hypothetical protein
MWNFSSTHEFRGKWIFHFTQTACLTELPVKCINGWLRKWIHSKFRPIALLHSFHTVGLIKPQNTHRILQRYRHYLECSAPGDKSLQLHVRELIQYFGSCNLMSEISDILPRLNVWQYIFETVKIICAHSVFCRVISRVMNNKWIGKYVEGSVRDIIWGTHWLSREGVK